MNAAQRKELDRYLANLPPHRTWRERARPAVRAVLARVGYHRGACTLEEARAALRDAYPFGPRKHYPYKVWCDETRKQLGLVSARGAEIKTDNGPLFAALDK